VPDSHAFEYAVIRIVPHVGREEFVNSGVVLFSRGAGFLGCQIALDRERLRAFVGAGSGVGSEAGASAGADPGAPPLDLEALEAHLDGMRAVCGGDSAAGPIARLSPSERFHWLVAPRSATIQISPVHGGVSEDPAATLRHLFQTLVAR
jgi:hypothetical protein